MKSERARYTPGEQLHLLALGYFHQDYDLEAETPLGVVEVYLDDATSGDATALRRDLQKLLAEGVSEQDRADAWLRSARASYNPRRDGLTFREWFATIVERIDSRG